MGDLALCPLTPGCSTPERLRLGDSQIGVMWWKLMLKQTVIVALALAEVLSDSRVSRASDVYGFGLMMLELYTCRPLFPGMGHVQVRLAAMCCSLMPRVLVGCESCFLAQTLRCRPGEAQQYLMCLVRWSCHGMSCQVMITATGNPAQSMA